MKNINNDSEKNIDTSMNNSVNKSLNKKDNSMSRTSLSNYSNKASFKETNIDLI